MTAKPTITDGEIEQEAREQLAVAAHGNTLDPMVGWVYIVFEERSIRGIFTTDQAAQVHIAKNVITKHRKFFRVECHPVFTSNDKVERTQKASKGENE